MKKKTIKITISFFILLFICVPGQSADVWDQSRAISLKILQEKLKAFNNADQYPDEIIHLADIQRITGYIVDRENKDIILMGKVDADLPLLNSEDIVVAFRNTFLKYTEFKDEKYSVTAPGCSIEPNPDVVSTLHDIGQKIYKGKDVKSVETEIDRWNKSCFSPQTVRIMGIPFHTNFTKILLTADYLMKGLAAGTETSDIPEFYSLTDLTLEKLQEIVEEQKTVFLPKSSRNRFWFYPGENMYIEHEDIIMIEECPVLLLTEESFLTQTGDFSGTGQGSEMAEDFASAFSDYYSQLSDEHPIYQKLENLFRHVAITKIIEFKSSHTEAGLDFGPLLDKFDVQETNVSEDLPGVPKVGKFQYRWETENGHKTALVWLPICGGVVIEFHISKENFRWDETGELSEIRSIVLNARPTPDAFFWDY